MRLCSLPILQSGRVGFPLEVADCQYQRWIAFALLDLRWQICISSLLGEQVVSDIKAAVHAANDQSIGKDVFALARLALSFDHCAQCDEVSTFNDLGESLVQCCRITRRHFAEGKCAVARLGARGQEMCTLVQAGALLSSPDDTLSTVRPTHQPYCGTIRELDVQWPQNALTACVSCMPHAACSH
jgi:hypothetical protein